MKKIFLSVMGFVLTLFFCAGIACAQEKLAYVDLGRLFDEYAKTKEYDKILADQEKAFEKERENKVNEVKKLQDSLNLLSDKEREGKKGDLENKIKELQEFDRSKTQDLRKERDERVQEIFKDIKGAIDEYAASSGYVLIFDSRALVFEAKNLDITDKVLGILVKKYPSKKQ